MEAIGTKVHHNTECGLLIRESVKNVCWNSSKCFSNDVDICSYHELPSHSPQPRHMEGWSFRGIGRQKTNRTTTRKILTSTGAKSEVAQAGPCNALGSISVARPVQMQRSPRLTSAPARKENQPSARNVPSAAAEHQANKMRSPSSLRCHGEVPSSPGFAIHRQENKPSVCDVRLAYPEQQANKMIFRPGPRCRAEAPASSGCASRRWR